MTAVVGLDLSLSSTGIAWTDGDAWHVDSWKPLNTYDTRYPRSIERLRHIRGIVLIKLDEVNPDVIVIEDTVARSHAASALGELAGVVKVAIADGGYPAPVLVSPAVVKKVATGRGNCDKTAVIVAARDRLRYTGTQSDEADSLWLLAIGTELAGRPIVKFTKAEQAVIAKIARPS